MTWRKIDCKERDEAKERYDLVPISSCTDLGGEFGDPSMFTEWGDRSTEEPVLRDHRWPPRYPNDGLPSHPPLPDSRPCEHYLHEIDLVAEGVIEDRYPAD